jgi:hypothetical protein
VFNKFSSCIETMCDTVFDKTNGSQVEQYDLDDVDNEEAPCDALRTMTIGDVRPQEVNEDQASSNEAAPPTHEDDQEVNKMKVMIKIKRWAMIKGELSKMKMRMIKKSQVHHHSLIQELDKSFNVTIRSTTFLVP